MTQSITFTVPGVPVAKQRARTYVAGGVSRTFTPTPTRNYEASVAECARNAMVKQGLAPMEGAVEATITVHFVPPTSWNQTKYRAAINGKYWPKKKDLDNVVKTILDGAQKGGVFLNDNCVCRLYADKRYSARDSVTVTVRAL